MPRIIAALLLASSLVPAQEPRRPNLVLILADDLGYGDLGCFGQKVIRTPQLDRMAAEGTRFTQFYAGSTVCAPSRCVLMTGLNTGHCFIRGNAKTNLRPTDVTAAKVLQDAGYATGLRGKWGLGHEGSAGVPTRQGFDSFFGYLDQTHAHNYWPSFLVRNEERVKLKNVVPNEGPAGQGVASERVEYSADLIQNEALAFLEERRSKPFFLYLAYTLPHANNEAKNRGMEIPDHGEYASKDWPEPEKGRAAMISRLDRDVGQILAKLRERGLEKDTIVLFTSDNGPHKEGGSDADFFDSNGPLRGTKRSLTEGGIRVPTIAWGPGRVPAGRTSGHVWGMWDVLPTLAELAGGKAPGGIDGVSMAPAVFGRDCPAQDFLYWEFHEGGFSQAVRHGDWKGIRKGLKGTLELYDLKTDPGEDRNVAAAHPDVVRRIEEHLETARTDSAEFPVREKR
jgi:arylsulfatase A-like enzyme